MNVSREVKRDDESYECDEIIEKEDERRKNEQKSEERTTLVNSSDEESYPGAKAKSQAKKTQRKKPAVKDIRLFEVDSSGEEEREHVRQKETKRERGQRERK